MQVKNPQSYRLGVFCCLVKRGVLHFGGVLLITPVNLCSRYEKQAPTFIKYFFIMYCILIY